jgi:hypothetical protein
MGWKQWVAVCAVIGFGILSQIPGHDRASTERTCGDHRHGWSAGPVPDNRAGRDGNDLTRLCHHGPCGRKQSRRCSKRHLLV